MSHFVTGLVIWALLAWTAYCIFISFGMRAHINPFYVFILSFFSPITLPLHSLWQWAKGKLEK